MSYSPHAAVTLPAPNQDRTVWALLAVVAVLVAAGAGWAVAQYSAPTWGDVETRSQISAREAALDGRQRGWSEGARNGRRESRLRSEYQALRDSRQAWSGGWNRGFQTGRDRAAATRGGEDAWLGASGLGDTYSGAGMDDLSLSSDLLTDVPGYATSPLSYDTDYGSDGRSLSDYYRGG